MLNRCNIVSCSARRKVNSTYGDYNAPSLGFRLMAQVMNDKVDSGL